MMLVLLRALVMLMKVVFRTREKGPWSRDRIHEVSKETLSEKRDKGRNREGEEAAGRR